MILRASPILLSAFVVFVPADVWATQCAIDQIENDDRIRVETKPLADGLQTYVVTLPPEISDKPLIEINLWVSSKADGGDKLVLPVHFENRSGSVLASFIAQPGWQSLGLVATYGQTPDPCEWTYVGIDDLDKDAVFAAAAVASDCSRSFSPIDVVDFLKGTEDSDAALAARREGDELTGYSIFRFQSVRYLVDAGLRNGDVLISVCDIPIADIFGGDYKSWPEVSFCCASDSGMPSLIFERWGDDKAIRVLFPRARD